MRITLLVDLEEGGLRDLQAKRAFDIKVNGDWTNNNSIIKAAQQLLESLSSPEVADEEFVIASKTVADARSLEIDNAILKKGLY